MLGLALLFCFCGAALVALAPLDLPAEAPLLATAGLLALSLGLSPDTEGFRPPGRGGLLLDDGVVAADFEVEADDDALGVEGLLLAVFCGGQENKSGLLLQTGAGGVSW